ncbi:hypothetical protein [Streptomyces hirsutus]|uniref:hypothetical protein n=1 Tax=Streptomyces hirsutus TaxID=35620 RepID=UPI0033ABD2EE
MAENVIGTPSHLCFPGRECAACRAYMAQERKRNDDEAREILNERSARKGWGGKWPCYYGRCGTAGEPSSILHDPADLVLIIAERALRYHVRFEHEIGTTGRVAICRPCHRRMRDRTLFDD